MSKNISIRQFAKSMGVSHTAVRKAIEAGRINKNADGTIDKKAATVAWETNTDLSKKREVPGVESPAPDPAEMEGKKESARITKAFATSRAVKEEFAARNARLDFEVKAKSLVMAEKVKMQAFQTGRIVRDTFLNLPNKIAHELAAEQDPDKVHARLTQAIHAALEMLFDQGKDAAHADDEEDDD